MSTTPVSREILDLRPASPTPESMPQRFDPQLARPFIYKSLSEETRAAYHRALTEFFAFVGQVHPKDVTPQDVIAYRDHLRVQKRRKANTVATKLAIVRSFFEYLKAGGIVPLNPASTRLVTPPEVPTNPQGRALTAKEVRHLLSGPDMSKPEGARDHAMMLIMLRLSLRLAEVCQLRLSSIKWSHGRWILKCKIKGGKEETWPLPKDVKQSIDEYLKLDAPRRHCTVTARRHSFSSPQSTIARWSSTSRSARAWCRRSSRAGASLQASAM
jgi:site-specific recombinase XerD